MQFSETTLSYLKGNLFSSGYEMPLSMSKEACLVDRYTWLEERVTGKNIIHVGCVDHVTLIEEKLKEDSWLQDRLARSASRCVGLDTNKDGIEFVRDSLGRHDVYLRDITSDELPHFGDASWDYIILAEVLEHIDNPVDFLRSIRLRHSGMISEIIVTVPNSLRYANFKNSLRNKEVINSDHRYWFTPYTLAKILTQSGLVPFDYFFVTQRPFKVTGLRTWLKKQLLVRFPALRDNLIITGKF